MDEIKEVTLTYLSGRQVSLNKKEALAALNRQEWNEHKPNIILMFERKDPFLKLYRDGQSYIFEMPDGMHEFENIDKLKEDKYFETLFSNIMKHLKEEEEEKRKTR